MVYFHFIFIFSFLIASSSFSLLLFFKILLLYCPPISVFILYFSIFRFHFHIIK